MAEAEAEESLASVVVGIDLGSTFSGFAFAHKDKPADIYTLYEWPGQEGRQYCKTHTGLFYVKQKTDSGGEAEYELTHWGWPALAQHLKGGWRDGVYLTDFKQHLAAPEAAGHLPETPSRIVSGLEMGWTGTNRRHGMAGTKTERDGRGGGFPEGLSVVRATADFLREISTLALKHVRETWGGHITGRDVQWCLTVPAIWEDSAKQIMRRCAEMAGLMEGPGCPRHLANTASPHPVRIVLESEAASTYCAQERLRVPNLRSGDEIMMAQIKEEKTKIEVGIYTKGNDDEGSSEDKEAVQSSGALCGGTHVDAIFFHFLRAVISGFDFDEVERQNPAAMTALMSSWSDLKMSFDGSRHRGPYTLAIPKEVTNSSKFYDTKESEDRIYDGEMELTVSDIKQIFDPVVDRIIELLQEAITPRLKVLVLDGSFSASPYLQDRLKAALADTLGNIVMPLEAFSSMFEGAMGFLVSLDLVISQDESTIESRSRKLKLENGDEVMVADIGGGTTDIVVHMLTTDDDDQEELKLKETVQSSGGVCGGKDVDANFFRFLRDRISGFSEVENQNPAAMTALQWSWFDLKASFDGSQDWGPRSLAIPKAVTKTWNFYDTKGSGDREYHGRMELTVSDMKEIFDPVVDRIIGLIREAITPGLKHLLLVGGFSASPYLRARVKEELAGTLEDQIILMAPEPGSVVCEGAVVFGFFPDFVVSGSEDLVISALEEAAKAVKIRLVNFANAVIDRGYADRLSFPRHERHSFPDIDFMDPEFASKRRGMRYRTAYGISTLMFRSLDREYGASNSFKEFQALKYKSSNPSFIDEVMEVVEADAADHGNGFHQFVWQNFRDMIPDNLLKEACGLRDILRRFVLLAIAVWQLQRLALSFHRNAKILVPCGANFDERYMLRIADKGEKEEAHTGPLKVGFMVVPGFRLGKIIVKSQVYIT